MLVFADIGIVKMWDRHQKTINKMKTLEITNKENTGLYNATKYIYGTFNSLISKKRRLLNGIRRDTILFK